jgi:hypothetical protein
MSRSGFFVATTAGTGRGRSWLRQAAAVGIAALLLGSLGGPPSPVDGAPGSYTYETYGLDRACAPTTTQMNAFWLNTPYYHFYVYVGGSNRFCKDNT